MRITRFLWATLVAANVLSISTASSADVEPVEYIVNSQVISDEVSGTYPSGEFSDSDQSVLESGTCEPGSACAAGANGGSGNFSGHLAGMKSFVGDLRQGGFAGDISSGCVPRTYGYPDLFYNYYTQGNCNATNAQMYISPVPTPANVGHTFYTYQPFMPHEMLYWHKDRYHNYYDGGRGTNRTKVHYFGPPVRQAASNLYWNHIRIPR